MSQKNETTVLVLAFLTTAALLGAGFWWFTRSSGFNPGTLTGGGNDTQPNQPQASPSASNPTFTSPTSVPSGTTVRIEGSTSMVQINQARDILPHQIKDYGGGFQTSRFGIPSSSLAGFRL